MGRTQVSAPIKKKSIGYMVVPDYRDALTTLDHTVLAEKAGFSAIWIPDHFHPWFHTGANEYHSWIWMSTAMDRVKKIPFGTAITAPILRYHPALIAQAFATLETIH